MGHHDSRCGGCRSRRNGCSSRRHRHSSCSDVSGEQPGQIGKGFLPNSAGAFSSIPNKTSRGTRYELPLSIAVYRSEWTVRAVTILAFLPSTSRLRVGDDISIYRRPAYRSRSAMVSILNPRGFYVQDSLFSCRNPFSRKSLPRGCDIS